MRSKCRFVIARVYPNGNIEYIDMSNNAIISGGGNKPNYDTYANSLEGAIQHLKPQQPIQENNNKYTNKNIMKINESQLRKIIKESIKNTLNEMDFFDNANTKPQKEKFMWPKTGEINIGGQLDIRKVMDFIQKKWIKRTNNV